MATRYIIGKGELMTHNIPPPGKTPGTKNRPYTLAENLAVVVPQIESANRNIEKIPGAACPENVAVIQLTLHPAFMAKSWFPVNLLREARLVSVGSKTVRVRPRMSVRAKGPAEVDTTMLFVAGQRETLAHFAKLAESFAADSAAGLQFAEIESIAAMRPQDRISLHGRRQGRVFEVGLHLWPDVDTTTLRTHFKGYAKTCGFSIQDDMEFIVGRLLFLAVEGDHANLNELAKYTLLRVVRPMPQLRGIPTMARAHSPAATFQIPNAAPFSREPKVAILDGGLPDRHVLEPFINRYFLSDPNAHDVPGYVDHGLGVTSALLFGPLEPDAIAPRPYAYVDHHRVLDANVAGEDPYELYRTLGHIEEILLSRQYQFINLSLGPALSAEDSEVHAWTAVIDQLLSNGETLLTVAAGNNGEADRGQRLDRIQVPADCVNAIAVGATNVTSDKWARASYSARGPGRQPGRRKPDLVAFGGSPKEYFHVAASGLGKELAPMTGTSFAAPYVLRTAVGIRSILGSDIYPLTIRALLIHASETHANHDVDDLGWGRVTGDLDRMITCGDGVARVIYQGTLKPGKFLRAAVPLPNYECKGKVSISATFCYASPIDPQDASSYTKAGLLVTFRPHSGKKKAGAQNATSKSFFQAAEFRTEAELRDDLGKWETILSATHSFFGTSLDEPVFDIHYNARDGGDAARGSADPIPYALVLTINARNHPQIYEDILIAHKVLQPIQPAISIPITT